MQFHLQVFLTYLGNLKTYTIINPVLKFPRTMSELTDKMTSFTIVKTWILGFPTKGTIRLLEKGIG